MSTELRVEKIFSRKNNMLSNYDKNRNRNRIDEGKEQEITSMLLEPVPLPSLVALE